jgi:serine-type D-Ala-D-Ala carboxypeptidase/endopeptidase
MRAAGAGRYQPLVEREICQPLGMTDTRVELSAAEIPRRAQGYRKNGFPAPFEMPTWPAFTGAGALRSTMNDMLAYLAFNMGLTSTPLTPLPPTLQRRWHPTMRAGGYVGLAWQMMPLRGSGLTVTWKDGGTIGFSSFIAFVRETGTGVVVLVNTRGSRHLRQASSKLRSPEKCHLKERLSEIRRRKRQDDAIAVLTS